MPKLAKEMGALNVSGIKAAGLHFVGRVQGLALQVTAGGGRSWLLRVVIGGHRREMGLGAYPEVTLAQARVKASEARALIRQGVDPIERLRAARSALHAAAAAALTFSECADSYIKAHEAGWQNAKHARAVAQYAQTARLPGVGFADGA